jgi:hypothetical protein
LSAALGQGGPGQELRLPSQVALDLGGKKVEPWTCAGIETLAGDVKNVLGKLSVLFCDAKLCLAVDDGEESVLDVLLTSAAFRLARPV